MSNSLTHLHRMVRYAIANIPYETTKPDNLFIFWYSLNSKLITHNS
ncbi:MAG: hypothetical protein V7K15_17630 [Nostoc sp.]